MFVDIAARFGDNLAHHRKRADLSQRGWSRLTSLHRTEISQLERGFRLCRVDTLVKLTCSLEISADELLAGISWSPGDYRPGGFKEAGREMKVADQFGSNLAYCRSQAKLSQEELAVRASLHRTAVGQLERGERVARVDTLIKLAGSLGIPPKNCSMGWAGTQAERASGSTRIAGVADGD